MKRLQFFAVFLILLLALGGSFYVRKYEIFAESQVDGPPPFLRLHILANSDEKHDQKIKLAVRDMILSRHYQEFGRINNFQEAVDYIKNNLAAIEHNLNQYLSRQNCDYKAVCTVVEENFKTSNYWDFQLPEGKYKALKITLGEGLGRNWWCVLYPPLCFYELNKEEALSVVSPNRTDTQAETGAKQSFFKALVFDKLLKVWITQ